MRLPELWGGAKMENGKAREMVRFDSEKREAGLHEWGASAGRALRVRAEH